MLFPLMDMFFILLLFFLVTSGFKPREPAEPGHLNAIPKVGTGKAQILLQMIDKDNLIWLDNTCFGAGWKGKFPEGFATTLTSENLLEKLDNYIESFGICAGNKILVVIRAPDSLNWGDINKLELSMESTLDSLIGLKTQGINSPWATVMSGKKLEFSLVEGPADSLLARNINPQVHNKVEIKW